jgi:hypothetical protein
VRAAKADVELAVVQRAGFLLDLVGAARVTESLAQWLLRQKPNLTRLRPGSRIWWGADWPGGDGTVDTYREELPAAWWIALQGTPKVCP